MTYRKEAWFALLAQQCERSNRQQVAKALGVSAPVVSQVLNGSGKYGAGQASTERLAQRVLHTYSRFQCPHLCEQQGEVRMLDADQCRAFAHRAAPSGSPRDLQHWQACNRCPHKAHTAPVVPREIKRRGQRGESQADTPAGVSSGAST